MDGVRPHCARYPNRQAQTDRTSGDLTRPTSETSRPRVADRETVRNGEDPPLSPAAEQDKPEAGILGPNQGSAPRPRRKA